MDNLAPAPTDTAPDALHEAAPVAGAPVATEARPGLMVRLRDWLPRLMLLGVIWGIAVFLWGTFGAWTQERYQVQERRVALAEVPAVDAWLKAATDVLAPLAGDGRLATAMDLPAGVESLPVQRVLYEFAYLNNRSEVYLIDLLRHRVGRTAGAVPLPQAVLDRLAEMETAPQMLLGMGLRGGQVLLMRSVAVRPPYKLAVVIPVSLATLASGQPTFELSPGRKVSLVVPHSSGWVEWRDGAQGFEANDALQDAMKRRVRTWDDGDRMVTLVPLPGWPGVALSLQSPPDRGGVHLLPKLLVVLWALLMSAIVVWVPALPLRRKMAARIGPLLAPLGKGIVPLGAMVHKLADAIAVKLREGGGKDIPLVAGPGELGQNDFMSEAELLRRKQGVGLAKRPPLRGAAAGPRDGMLAQGGTELAAHKTPRTESLTAMGKPMAWPAPGDALPLPPKAEIERPVDKDDVEAVVLDCFKQRRVRLLYQPIYRALDDMPVMHEVYARLVRGDGHIITPDVFLPIAIKHKLTLELDLMVLRKVINEHFTGVGVALTPLALNISSTSLDGIAYLQEMASLSPRVLQHLNFEVSSQEMIRDPKALKLLKDLQRHGGNLAVDYFGGGTAMLEASKAMGFNYVKMNCSRLIGTDAGKKEIITLGAHARAIQLPMILEMISEAEDLTFCRKAGADFLQGYALMRPSEGLTSEPLNADRVKVLAAAVGDEGF